MAANTTRPDDNANLATWLRARDVIPFVFHGPRIALPDVDKLPLGDIIHVNLDHCLLDADYKHGLHFTALPTAWVADTVEAVAGFLESKGHGLSTFENAQNRDERLIAVLDGCWKTPNSARMRHHLH